MAGSGTITSANAILMITVPNLFPTPQQLQGFAAEDIYDFEGVDNAELMMGVDGHLAAGWIPKEVVQSITLMADSASNGLFETWYRAEQTAREKFPCSGTVILNATGRSYTQSRGFLTNYSPAPKAGKVLQPRKFSLTWETVLPQVN